MNSLSFGDLAQSFMLQRRGFTLQSEMARLNKELVTGQVSDVKSVLAGNVSYLTQIENDLRTLGGYQVAATEAAQFTDAVQSAMDRIQTLTTDFSTGLLASASSASAPVLAQMANDSRSEMAAVINALNTTVGGRSLFAGAATDSPAIADVDTILDGMRTAVAGLTDPADVWAAAQAWFDDPAGFAATAYLGSDTDLSPFRVSDAETVDVSPTAKDGGFRNLLLSLGVGALADDPAIGFGSSVQREVLDTVGSRLFQGQDDLIAMRAAVGGAQARIDAFTTRHAAELTSLEFAKGALLRADPYETATQLEEVQFQLQSLYTVTARMSELSLVNFIR
ncbi:MAG: flagellin [Pseudomonadota bacterium]